MTTKAVTAEQDLRKAVGVARDVGMTESLVRKIVEQTLNKKRG